MLKMEINDLSEIAEKSLTSVLRENSIGYKLSEKSELETYRIEIDMKYLRIQSMITSDNIIIINNITGNIIYLLMSKDFSFITII